MAIGPVEYLIIAFPGNQFSGEIAPALAQLVDDGTIRIIDLAFITKDSDGNVLAVEFDEHGDLEAFAAIDAEIGGVITDDDIAHAALDLEPNSSAALLIWEDAWAAPLADAVRASGGVIVEGARIPYELVESVMVDLNAAS
jgi:Family of unknown function (DUF6325)